MNFKELEEKFKDEGFTYPNWGGHAPVQGTMFSSDGYFLYFRARGQGASLTIWEGVPESPHGLENMDLETWRNPLWAERYHDPEWGRYDAGWITPEKTYEVFNKLWRIRWEAYRNG